MSHLRSGRPSGYLNHGRPLFGVTRMFAVEGPSSRAHPDICHEPSFFKAYLGSHAARTNIQQTFVGSDKQDVIVSVGQHGACPHAHEDAGNAAVLSATAVPAPPP